MLAILHALKKWRPYLMGRHFKVKTDPDSLKYFLEQRLSSEEQQKWVTKMLGYDFEIIYKKGKQNVVVDTLSRKDEDVEALLCAISIIQPDWINEAREEWKNDEEVWHLFESYNKIPLKQKILMELHTSPLGGNSGFLKTYLRVKKEFFWEGLKSDIQKFVAECLIFQHNKVETIKTSGLLQPLSIPSQRWEEVSMDFITGLPTFEGKSVIMVVVDRLTNNENDPIYGTLWYQPPSITSYLRENSKVQAVEHHIEHQQQVLQLLKDNLVLAQNRMKQQADQHRSERSFDVGDWVFPRLQPYKQMSLKQAKKDNKLSPKYYGPYKVLQKIGTMAYKLELPAASRLHPVFHVSCLNKVIGDKLPVQTILSELDEEGKIILEPEAVIETRTRQLRNRSISEYLIKWKNLPAEASTWEDENFLQKHPELLKH
eukprot:PITA_36062